MEKQNSRKVIFSLDLGMKTGWACFTKDGRVLSGVFHCGAIGAHPGRSFTQWRHWLNELLNRYQPDILAYEKVVNRPDFFEGEYIRLIPI